MDVRPILRRSLGLQKVYETSVTGKLRRRTIKRYGEEALARGVWAVYTDNWSNRRWVYGGTDMDGGVIKSQDSRALFLAEDAAALVLALGDWYSTIRIA